MYLKLGLRLPSEEGSWQDQGHIQGFVLPTDSQACSMEHTQARMPAATVGDQIVALRALLG